MAGLNELHASFHDEANCPRKAGARRAKETNLPAACPMIIQFVVRRPGRKATPGLIVGTTSRVGSLIRRREIRQHRYTPAFLFYCLTTRKHWLRMGPQISASLADRAPRPLDIAGFLLSLVVSYPRLNNTNRHQ